MNRVKNNILATLAYFDLFKYPLTNIEIYRFINGRVAQTDLECALRDLVISRSVYQFGNFYTLRNNHHLITRRYRTNKLAADKIKTAGRLSDILIQFPFVKGIAVSGSLSKNYADANSDIDLFIITTKNRLWIARTLMAVFKKVMALVRPKICFNLGYCIDESHLKIGEQNMHTAIEVVTLVPLQGDVVLQQFYAANRWTRCYLPNKIMRLSSAKSLTKSFFKLMVEALFNNAVGDMIDNQLMKLTARYWAKKAKLKPSAEMLATKHQAKPNPGNLQAHLLEDYENKISEIQIVPQNLLAN